MKKAVNVTADGSLLFLVKIILNIDSGINCIKNPFYSLVIYDLHSLQFYLSP